MPLPVSGSFNVRYRAVRRASRVFDGPLPITQSVNKAFGVEGFLEVAVTGIAVPQTVTVLGDRIETFFFEPGDRGSAGLTAFTSVDIISSTVGATQGGLLVTLVDLGGAPVVFDDLIEERRGFFEKRGLPVAFSNFGEVRMSEASLIKMGGEEIFAHDLIGGVGETFTVIRSSQGRDIGGKIMHQLDLKRVGREPEP